LSKGDTKERIKRCLSIGDKGDGKDKHFRQKT